MERKECKRASRGAMKNLEEDNRKNDHESQKKTKAIMELRETRRKHRDKQKQCTRRQEKW